MSKKSMKQFNAKNTAPKKAVKNNKRKVAEWVLAILILIWTVGTVLGVVGFVRTLPKASAEETQSSMQVKDRNKSIYAPSGVDEWYVPLDLFTGMSVFYSTSSYSFQSIVLGQVGLIFTGSLCDIVYDTYDSNGNATRIRYSLDDDDVSFPFSVRLVRNGSLFTASSLNTSCYLTRSQSIDFELGWYLSDYRARFTFNSTLNIIEFDFQLYFQRVGYSTTSLADFDFEIILDSSYTYSRIFAPIVSQTFTTTGEFHSFKWSESNHYIESFQLYQNGYQNGLANGYDEGFNDGEASGYTEGFTDGETQGYNTGYNVGKADGFTDGVANANEYSFAGLLGSVIDVPVNAFKSLFNFEILGVNLASFFMALLTIMIILAITKLFI